MLSRTGLVVIVAILIAGVAAGGDLPILPAVALVFLAWGLILAVDSLHWLLRTGLPPVVTTVHAASIGAWRAVREDPLGSRLHRTAGRLRPILRPAAPAIRWLGRRLGPQSTGLTLTMTAAVATAATFGLHMLGSGVDDPHSSVSLFDLRVSNMASQLELTGQRRVMEALTNVGNTRSVVAIAAVLLIGALVAHAWRSGVLLLATLIMSSLLVTMLKLHHARPRPALGKLVETSTSFPSGHAAASLSLALGAVLWWWAAGRRRLPLLAACVIPIGLLIGYSRAYLSIHWLSDVAAGWLVALLAAALVVGADRLVAVGNERLDKSSAKARTPLFLSCSVAVVLALVLAVVGRHNYPTRAPTVAPVRLASAIPERLLPLIPHYSETLFGRHMEPVSIVIVAPESALRNAIKRAHWTVADTVSPARLLRTYWAGIQGRSDPTAPVTPTFLDTRVEDLAIQQQSLGHGVKARHHARLWRLPITSPNRCPAWAVTTSLDDRVEWTVRTLLPNHHIAPAIDVERELLTRILQRNGGIHDRGRFAFVGPTLGSNAAGDPFFTDGKIAVLDLAGC